MANEKQYISKIKIVDVEYDVKDIEAREALENCVGNVTAAADGGLTVDNTDANNLIIALDDSITFIFDGGTASEFIEEVTE